MLPYRTTDMTRWGLGLGRALHWEEITRIFISFSDRIIALGGVKPVITHRMTGPWGPGKGAPLEADEVDTNWHNVNEQIAALDGFPMEELNEFDPYDPIGADRNNFALDTRLLTLEQARKNAS